MPKPFIACVDAKKRKNTRKILDVLDANVPSITGLNFSAQSVLFSHPSLNILKARVSPKKRMASVGDLPPRTLAARKHPARTSKVLGTMGAILMSQVPVKVFFCLNAKVLISHIFLTPGAPIRLVSCEHFLTGLNSMPTSGFFSLSGIETRDLDFHSYQRSFA